MENVTATGNNITFQDGTLSSNTSSYKGSNTGIERERDILIFVRYTLSYYGQFMVCGFGTSTNFLLMISMLVSPKLLKNSGGMLIFALAFADCSLNVSTIIYSYDYYHQVVKDFTYCLLYTYYWRIMRCLSHLITMLISINRFALVCYPFTHMKVTSRKAVLAQLVAMLMFSSLGSIYVFYTQDPTKDYCGIKASALIIFYIGFGVVDSLFSNVIPVLIAMILTFKVIRTLKANKAALGEAVQRPTASIQPVTKAQQAENNLTNALVAVNVAFIVFVLPYIITHLTNAINFLTHGLILSAALYNLDTAYHIMYLFEHINYAINLFLYAWFSPAMREALVKLITFGCCRNGNKNQMK